MLQYGKESPKHGLLSKTEATVEAVDSRRNLIVVRTGQDDLVTYNPSRLKTATNDSRVYRPELQPITQGERIRITRNDKELNVRAGDFAPVTRTDDKGGLKVRLDSGKEIELTAKQAQHVEHGYAVENGRRVSAERFIVTGDTAEAKTLKSVPVQARDLSTHTTGPAVQQQKAPERERDSSTNRLRSRRNGRFSAATVSASASKAYCCNYIHIPVAAAVRNVGRRRQFRVFQRAVRRVGQIHRSTLCMDRPFPRLA